MTTQIKIGAGGAFANVLLAPDGSASDQDTQLQTLNADDMANALEAISEWRNAAANGDTQGQLLAQAEANAVNVYIQEV